VTASLALAAGTLALAAPSQAATAPAAKALAGTSPDWAKPSADKGTVPAATTVSARIYWAGKDPAGLAAYAKAVADRSSGYYGKYLTPAQEQAKFGATPEQITAVKQWLTGAGLTVTATTEHYIEVSGTTAAADKAFSTSLHRYSVDGGVHRAPASDVVVPASVASAVLGVTGLADLTPKAKSSAVPVAGADAAGSKKSAGFPNTPVCSSYWGQKKVPAGTGPAAYSKNTPYDQCSFYPAQLRKAYGITKSGLTGKGATVAIVDAYGSSTMLADANQFATNHGDKAFRKGQYTEVVDPTKWTNLDACQGASSWAGEEALDVEMVHGLAPDANVVYVGANSCEDPDLMAALSTIVDKRLADVVSNSWGEIMHSSSGDMSQSTIAAWEQIFEQGAVEGIGFDFSSGDCGDNSPAAAATGVNCDPTTTEAQDQYPTSDPWVTSVGGTALGEAKSDGTYGFETDMGTHRSVLSADGKSWTPFPGAFYFGGGGGTSQDFAQPWYQAGTVPGSLSHTLVTGAHSKTAQRVVPDVAMNGDLYTSVLVGMSDGAPYSEGGYGGTSVSAPEFSAVQADAIQARHGFSIGFANPEIYLRAKAGLFHDVVNWKTVKHETPLSSVYDGGIVGGSLKVRLVTFGQDTSLFATKGYDDATGVGSPTAAYLQSFRNGF
jgi:subtilase family serine protease